MLELEYNLWSSSSFSVVLVFGNSSSVVKDIHHCRYTTRPILVPQNPNIYIRREFLESSVLIWMTALRKTFPGCSTRSSLHGIDKRDKYEVRNKKLNICRHLAFGMHGSCSSSREWVHLTKDVNDSILYALLFYLQVHWYGHGTRSLNVELRRVASIVTWVTGTSLRLRSAMECPVRVGHETQRLGTYLFQESRKTSWLFWRVCNQHNIISRQPFLGPWMGKIAADIIEDTERV